MLNEDLQPSVAVRQPLAPPVVPKRVRDTTITQDRVSNAHDVGIIDIGILENVLVTKVPDVHYEVCLDGINR